MNAANQSIIGESAILGEYDTNWPYYPKLLEQPVPRFTSYPPATAFHEGLGSSDYAMALENIKPGTTASLYIHIPYCQKICYYCGCNTGAAGQKRRLDNYLDTLDREIDKVGNMLGGRTKVKNIALGGGSPNAIEPIQFVRLLDRLATIFGTGNPIISVEIDPRNFTLEWAMAISAANISRVSLGVQTFAPHVQQAIGRIQPLTVIEECMAGLRMRGLDNINFDLMYGLPEQTLDDLSDTVEKTIALKPSRVALFGYAHLPHMIPRQRKIQDATLPDLRLRFEQARLGYSMFTDAGYIPIGFDHFVLPDDSLAQAAQMGMIRRNFQGFTDDNSDILIGMGASAISQFPDTIFQNEKNTGQYRAAINNGQFATAKGVVKSDEDIKVAHLVERLLCDHKVDIISPDYNHDYESCLTNLEELDLISCKDDQISIPDAARHYSRQIANIIANNYNHLGFVNG